MSPVSGPLDTEAVANVLAREHERAGADEARLVKVRPQIDAAKAAGKSANELYPKDVYLAIEPAMGRFLHLAATSIGARRIVEFGTSFGISTIYLAAAVKEAGGKVIGTEMEPAKAARAQANLADAGLSESAEIRVGDALETLKGLEGPVDLLFLDGWKDLYLPVLEMMQSVLREGALVLADNIHTFPDELASYMDAVNASPFR
ncbi:MAG: class I SAM-dependent methyltransferase, partial [Hyphomicrobiales bacterium]|nr:class I SAM-dependent methyltransferase [Hyphomicrobiales bacterium]